MSLLRRAWSVIWKICLFFLLWALLLAPLIVPLGSWLEKTRHTSPHLSRLYMETMVVVTVLGATWIMVRWIDRRRFVTVGFEPRHALRDLSVGVLIGACWVAASILPLLLGNVASFQDSPTWSGTLGWSGLAIFLNAVAQEVLARGYFFQVVRSATTPSLAILVSSLLFTALHAGAFDRLGLPVLNVFLAGVLFGLACLVTGNLWLPISIHFSWNFLLGSVLGSAVSGKTLGRDQELLHLFRSVDLDRRTLRLGGQPGGHHHHRWFVFGISQSRTKRTEGFFRRRARGEERVSDSSLLGQCG